MLRIILAAVAALVMITASLIPDEAYARQDAQRKTQGIHHRKRGVALARDAQRQIGFDHGAG